MSLLVSELNADLERTRAERDMWRDAYLNSLQKRVTLLVELRAFRKLANPTVLAAATDARMRRMLSLKTPAATGVRPLAAVEQPAAASTPQK